MRILAGLIVVLALFGLGFLTGQWWARQDLATALEPVELETRAEPSRVAAEQRSVISAAGSVVPAFAEALNARDWESIVRLLERARLEGRDEEFAALYPAMRAVADDLIAAEAPLEAAALLSSFTALNPADAEARFALADAWVAAGEEGRALDPVLEVLSSPLTTDIAERAGRYRDELISAERARFSGEEDSAALVGLYERLREAEPVNEAHQLGLAAAQLAANDLAAAEATLGAIAGFDADPEALAELRQQLAVQQQRLQIERRGNELYAAAQSAGQQLRLLVDTGASQTALSPAALRTLAARRTGEVRRVLTAGGEIEASVYEVEALEIAGRAFEAVEVLALDALPGGADGLLGLDLLQQVGDLGVLSAGSP